jgi:uncharacterized protein with HEPN domain
MQLKSLKVLFDIQEACRSLKEFTSAASLDEYGANKLLRSAVERQFLIVGEAMTRLLKTDPSLEAAITDARKIIRFRNILVHGYDVVEHKVV